MAAANSDDLPMLSKMSPEEIRVVLTACASFDALKDQMHHTGADPLQQ